MKGVRIPEGNNCTDSQVHEEGGAGGAPGAGAEIFPLQPVKQTIVRQAVPCSPGRSTVEQIPACSPGRTSRWSKGMPEGGCDPMEQAAGRTHSPMERGAHDGAG